MPKTITITSLDQSIIYYLTPFTPIDEVMPLTSSYTMGFDGTSSFTVQSDYPPKGTKIFVCNYDSRFIVTENDGQLSLGTSYMDFANRPYYILLETVHSAPFFKEAAYILAYQRTNGDSKYDTVTFNLKAPDDICRNLTLMLKE